MSENIPKFEGFFAKSTTRDELLHEMADHLAKEGRVKPTYGDAVIARENTFATGIPCEPISVAIPHCERGHVIETTILVARLPQKVTFNRIDDPDLTVDVDIAFMLAVDSNEGQLEALSKIMELIQDEELISKVYLADSPEEIGRLVLESYNA